MTKPKFRIQRGGPSIRTNLKGNIMHTTQTADHGTHDIQKAKVGLTHTQRVFDRKLSLQRDILTNESMCQVVGSYSFEKEKDSGPEVEVGMVLNKL